MPTLAARSEDLEILIEEFIESNARAGRGRLMLAAETVAALKQYAWPGNIRELGNLIERLSILCADRPVRVIDLPQRYRPTTTDSVAWEERAALTSAAHTSVASVSTRATEGDEEVADADIEAEVVAVEWTQQPADLMNLPAQGIDLRAHLLTIERSLIAQALERTDGTVAHAAKLLNLRRTTLVEKLRKLGMVAA
jgi:sigma-54 specific flagellar transcriptional regulator A